jgi:NTE family protein
MGLLIEHNGNRLSIGVRMVCIVLLCFVAVVQAQDKIETGYKKIGLVLSGGGAKGLAHIGALKVIEEAGVKIDYIGGTSMGAIIGALYASGYTVHQLDSIFQATDFTSLIRDNLPRSAKTFYDKEDSERYALTLPFDGFKVSVPPAYSGGQNIYNELVRILYHVKDIKDFSKLPIPFVCIATDIETGNEVILNSGYLPEVIMASGTFPSLFAPVILDGKVLIDGGVVNNYPIEKVRAMGADIIIGVDVQHGLSDRESLRSATEILLQINNYQTVADMVEKSADTDIYIKPKIEKYSVIDFNKADEIIKAGELAAIVRYTELQQISSTTDNAKPVIEPFKESDSITVNRLLIKGDNIHTRGYVKGKLRFKLGTPITFSKLKQGMGNLNATGNFQTNRYKLVSNGVGEDLILSLDESANTAFFRVGAHYDDLYKSAAILNFTKKNLLFRDDRASMDFILGDNPRYNFEYYIDKGSYWSFGINSRYNDFEKEIAFSLISNNFEVPPGLNINTINLDVTDITNQVYVQTVLQEEFAFTLGAEYKFLKFSTRTLGDLTQANALNTTTVVLLNDEKGRTFFERSNFFSVFAGLKLDTYDDKYFPTSGLFFEGDFHYYLLSSDFNENFKDFSVSKARMGGAFSILDNLSVNVETEGGFKLGTSSVASFDFVLGGFGTNLINNLVPFYGYDFLSLPGNSFVKAYGRLDYEFVPKHHFLGVANFANVDDDIFRTGEWFSTPNFSGYGLGYGWESFLGPVQFIYSWSPEIDRSNVFFSIGYWF